ncbi:MAG TPA: Maf family protein [Candidatus Angelobacter sp.]|jgi:septum formation protein|nr:Maf family protein [Candidatus Angelobacter sp.]
MLHEPRLILASGSPRRQELLRGAEIEFEVFPADIREDLNPGEPPLDYALRMAREKALKVAAQFPSDYVLAADTIVVLDDQVLAKPRDSQDAQRMLAMLSDRGHQVRTAVSLVAPSGSIETQSCVTAVSFRKLGQDEILKYVATGEPLDKAGAYAIQGGAASWVVRVEGDYSNVVGLPMALVGKMLRGSGFKNLKS